MENDALIGPDGKVDLRDTNVVESWLCIDCGYNTAPGMFGRVELERAFETNGFQGVEQTIDSKSEVYSVRNVIWTKAGMEPWGGCLCIACLESFFVEYERHRFGSGARFWLLRVRLTVRPFGPSATHQPAVRAGAADS